MRGREKIAAEKDETNSNILVQYISALAVGLHMPLSELVSLTLF
jgi:hypothetical protein